MKTTTTLRPLLVLIFLFMYSFTFSIAIYCPDDVWVDCDEELWDLSVYGNATYWNGWDYVDAGEPQVYNHLNSCGTGYIKRKWSIEDEDWNIISCHQIIYVEGGVFTGNNIDWPESPLNAEGCDPDTDPDTTGEPDWDYVDCSLIGVNHSDQLFHINSGCKKLLRTWTIIDWCTFDPQSDYGDEGSWTFTQTIKISNSDEPEIMCIEEVIKNSYNCEDEFVNVPTPQIGENNCSGEFEISHNSVYADQQGPDASGTYPVGTTTVKFIIEYGCGLKEACYVDVVVKDSSKPVPYCLMSIVTALMPIDEDLDGTPEDGMVEIWAKDFDLASFHPCDYGPLQFSFSEDVDSMSAMFTCEHVGSNDLKMYVTDPFGNQSYCAVELVVQNNAANIPNCEAQQDGNHEYFVRGQVKSMEDKVLDLSTIRMKDMEESMVLTTVYDTSLVETIVDSFYNMNGVLIYIVDREEIVTSSYDTTYEALVFEVMTDSLGTYQFDEFPLDRSYILSANKQEYPEHKVTIHDAMYLRDYVDGTIKIEDPYFHLAADMDQNGVIDYTDFYSLMNIVRDPNDEEILVDPWIMLDPKSENLNFEEACHLELASIDTTINDAHFMALLRGDISYFVELSELKEELGQRDINTDQTLSLKVYPNPFNDILQVSYKSESLGSIQLTITDLTGKRIINQKETCYQGENVYNLSSLNNSLQAGVYLFRLKTEEGNVIQKKIIKI